MPISQAFTIKYPGITNVLSSDIGVFKPVLHIPSFNPANTLFYKGIWDTGATNCAITRRVAMALGLSPVDIASVMGVHGAQDRNVYAIGLMLPNKVGFPLLRVTEVEEIGGSFDLLIGMDVIGNGDFAVTQDNGHTVMSYRTPHRGIIEFQSTGLDSSGSPGRNDLCSCGSGQKFKKCCGKP